MKLNAILFVMTAMALTMGGSTATALASTPAPTSASTPASVATIDVPTATMPAGSPIATIDGVEKHICPPDGGCTDDNPQSSKAPPRAASGKLYAVLLFAAAVFFNVGASAGMTSMSITPSTSPTDLVASIDPPTATTPAIPTDATLTSVEKADCSPYCAWQGPQYLCYCGGTIASDSKASPRWAITTTGLNWIVKSIAINLSLGWLLA